MTSLPRICAEFPRMKQELFLYPVSSVPSVIKVPQAAK
jgi:hypothetical protein